MSETLARVRKLDADSAGVEDVIALENLDELATLASDLFGMRSAEQLAAQAAQDIAENRYSSQQFATYGSKTFEIIYTMVAKGIKSPKIKKVVNRVLGKVYAAAGEAAVLSNPAFMKFFGWLRKVSVTKASGDLNQTAERVLALCVDPKCAVANIAPIVAKLSAALPAPTPPAEVTPPVEAPAPAEAAETSRRRGRREENSE